MELLSFVLVLCDFDYHTSTSATNLPVNVHIHTCNLYFFLESSYWIWRGSSFVFSFSFFLFLLLFDLGFFRLPSFSISNIIFIHFNSVILLSLFNYFNFLRRNICSCINCLETDLTSSLFLSSGFNDFVTYFFSRTDDWNVFIFIILPYNTC